jgi:flagellar biosynthetic protein FliR
MPASVLWSFLLALARVSGVIAFLPMPGMRNAPDLTRIVFALAVTLCLAPAWAAGPASDTGMMRLAMWLIAETSIGVLIGLFFSVLVESVQLGAQVLGLQAGFSYASTIDPGSQADSTVLQVFAQLLSCTLFFVLGLHRSLLALLAKTFETIPPGSFSSAGAEGEQVAAFVGTLFSNGLRIAFPVVALLLLVDISLALLARMQSQLQLLTVAFPAKMAAGLWFLAATLWVMPSVSEGMVKRAIDAAVKVLAVH